MTVRLVVFDVDGTMYHQPRLRRRMLVEVLLYLIRHPLRLSELMTVREYRRVHEHFGSRVCEDLKGALIAEVARNLARDPDRVRGSVEEWLFSRPLRHLQGRCLPEVRASIEELRRRDIGVTVLSDHFPVAKLKALGLEFDDAYYATRDDLNCLKPNPTLLLKILSDHQVEPANCVVVGDREDRDGALARAVGSGFVLYPNQAIKGNLLERIDACLPSTYSA